MSPRGDPPIWAACSAAFACGATLGAWAMRYYCSTAAAELQQQTASQQQQPGGPPRMVDLASLQGPLPSAPSSSPSPAPSVCSYSLPPTPRMNGRDGLGRMSSGGSSAGSGLRMVFVVRRDLGWGRQKLAVTTAHAALALFKKLFKARHPALLQWELAKGPKLVLRADDEEQLMAVLQAVRTAGIPHHSIAEAMPGRSSDLSGGDGSAAGGGSGGPDVPRRSRTILAIGPLPADEIPKIAPGLVLL